MGLINSFELSSLTFQVIGKAEDLKEKGCEVGHASAEKAKQLYAEGEAKAQEVGDAMHGRAEDAKKTGKSYADKAGQKLQEAGARIQEETRR